MKTINQQNIIHKKWMLRLLSEIASEAELATNIAFKGGSCASMLGLLDRFSVDLDFDLLNSSSKLKESLRKNLHRIFEDIDLSLDQESKTQLQFFLKYKSKPSERNTLKVEILDNEVKANDYQKSFIPDIVSYLQTQTIETMFANKLVAPVDRYEKHGSIATRDIYDINYFFNQGLSFKKKIIEERRNTSVKEYLTELVEFIDKNITSKMIVEDLNYLLSPKQFKIARKHLKSEVTSNLRNFLSNLITKR